MRLYFVFIFILIFSCQSNGSDNDVTNNIMSSPISAVDISYYPSILEHNPIFYNDQGIQINFLNSLFEKGVNTIRLRLWVNPIDDSSSFNDVKEFSTLLKSLGFKIWITPHFSDTWAHPGQQQIPNEWISLNFEEIKAEVYSHINQIMNEIEPDYIQIGNEINTGVLFPHGNIENNSDQFIEIINQGISAVRSNSSQTKIILHCAGFEASEWFFNLVNPLDYDIIGISYYPIWHGKSLNDLQLKLTGLSNNFGKEILIAETAYPFTLGWNDWTNNIVGLEEQLIVPDYPATPSGQQNFIRDLKNLVLQIDNGIGFCYWGAELIAWDGENSENGSVWENQALFDFENTELPVLQEFNLN
jgi:arabinogalactan endo-1,4-beta-galactosidase